MADRDVSPLDERIITDYATLPQGYVEHLQRKMDEDTEQRAS